MSLLWLVNGRMIMRNEEGVHHDWRILVCVGRDIGASIVAFRVPISMLKSLSAKSTSIEGPRTYTTS